MKRATAILFATLAFLSSAGQAQAPSKLSSAGALREDAGKGDSWTYRNPQTLLKNYQSFLVQPTAVYSDPAAQWGSTTPEERQKFASYMTKALRDELVKTYTIVERPGPRVATLRLTLMGVQNTTPLVATASRLTPMGFALNGLKSIRGKSGSMTGSAQVALEVSDAVTGELLFAAVRRRAPDALDIEATLTTQKTVEAVADDVAKSVRAGLDKVNGR